MSAWSDYKCGAISREEYEFECRREAMLDEYEEDKDEEDDSRAER